MFFFKRNKLVLDCFVNHPNIARMFPIEPAVKHFPDWWKAVPSKFEEDRGEGKQIKHPSSTIKKCSGLIDLYTNSAIIPMWSDFKLQIYPDNYEFYFANETPPACMITRHHPKQWEGGMTNYMHGKLLSPWLIKEKTGVNFTFMPSTWHLLNKTNNINFLPGTMSFNIQHNTNMNMFIVKGVKELVEIEGGEPMMHLIPMSDKELDIRIHVLTEPEYKIMHIESDFLKFHNGYATAKKRCPFSK